LLVEATNTPLVTCNLLLGDPSSLAIILSFRYFYLLFIYIPTNTGIEIGAIAKINMSIIDKSSIVSRSLISIPNAIA
jgi:hypothetical protein